MSATDQSLAQIREALSKAIDNDALLKNTFVQPGSATTGLQAYNLEAPAKNLVPWLTPLRNQIPREGGGFATQANWKAVTGYDTNMVHAGIVEGRRGALINYTMKEYYAAFRTLGKESSVTFEANLSAEKFDDLKARAVMGLLKSLMQDEEHIILGGNATNSLGTTPTPTVTASASGGTIGASVGVSVIAVALSYDAYRRYNSQGVGGTIPQTVTRTNQDGTSDTVNCGLAIKSAAGSATTSGGTTNSVVAKVTPVRGAYGYAWYAGTAGNEKLHSVTSISQVTITALPGSGQAASTLVGTDYSADTLIHDGLLGMIGQSAMGSYYNAVTAGSTLTTDGAGGIVEIDAALRYFYDNLRLQPDEIWYSTQEVGTVKKIILQQGAATSLARFGFTMAQGALMGGAVPKSYLSPYGTMPEIPLKQHPFMPPGTILFLTHNIPYDMNGIAQVMRIYTRQDYSQLEWPLRTRSYEYGVYTDQVLQHYFPPSMGIITNLAAG